MAVRRGSILWWLGMEDTQTTNRPANRPYDPGTTARPLPVQVPPELRNYKAPSSAKWTDEQKLRYESEVRRVQRILTQASHESCRQIARDQIERLIRQGII